MGDVLRTFKKQYINIYHPPPQHLKVIDAICKCRTSTLGGHAKSCTKCGAIHVFYNSCGNRHCPQCQAFEKEKWVEARKQELLPVPYLHLVFTLPHELNLLVLSNDRLIYSLLFKAVWKTIQQITQDKKWLGAQSGMIAVLHTWGSNLTLHPHLHCIIPCGGINEKQNQWIPTRKKRFLAPNKKVIAPIFKAIFLKLLRIAFEKCQLQFFGQARIYENLDVLAKLFRKLNHKNWNVFAKQPFGGPAQILNYLSRYTHRIAISNHRIIAAHNNQITFSYKNYKKSNSKGIAPIEKMTLTSMEFIRRFLLHVLPKGFQRIRYYGILAIRNRKLKLKNLQQILKYQPPPVSPLHWKDRLEQLTGKHPDECPFCKTRTLIVVGNLVQTTPTLGRSPPIVLQIITPEGQIIEIGT